MVTEKILKFGLPLALVDLGLCQNVLAYSKHFLQSGQMNSAFWFEIWNSQFEKALFTFHKVSGVTTPIVSVYFEKNRTFMKGHRKVKISQINAEMK